jgi:hypothetical protein
MNTDKLNELKQRAEKASKIADEIKSLQKHDRRGNYLKFTGSRDGYSNLIDDALLDQIFDLGKAELLRRKESELNDLLGESKPDTHIGTLDSSDTWEQPASPPSWDTSAEVLSCDSFG